MRILYSIALAGVLLVRVCPEPNATRITVIPYVPPRLVRSGSHSRSATNCLYFRTIRSSMN